MRRTSLILALLANIVLLAGACARAQNDAPTTVVAARTPAAATVVAENGLVVSASAIASRIGTDVLEQGGNAVDAAVATGFALAVTYPAAGNIGGGGFMVIRFPDGRVTSFDFREKAPLAAHPLMFTDSAGAYSSELHHNSHVAVGVPGTVAGFALAHERYGSRPWAQLVKPAMTLARDGFAVPDGLARSLASVLPRMQKHPASVAAFSKAGAAYTAGEIWRQLDLANTLERIQRAGRDGFYKGETARLIADEMRRGGGLITEEDLTRYRAVERTPLRGSYRGYEIITMGPPSGGGITLIEMLNVLEGYDLKSLGHNAAPYLHHLTEAMRRAFIDRARFAADSDFVAVPVARLTSKNHAAALRATIDPTRATVSLPEQVNSVSESDQTTHYSIVDRNGLAVSVTYTLEAGYGSKITVPGAGFLLNNEMGDFNAQPGVTTADGRIGTPPNIAQPEKRMLSSMTPTIVAKDGAVVAVVGSPGGRTIPNTVLQVLLNIIDFGMDIQAAVNAPRMHHQWLPDRLSLERDAVSQEAVEQLRALGHNVSMAGRQGTAHSIAVSGGRLVGAPDPRDADAGAAGH